MRKSITAIGAKGMGDTMGEKIEVTPSSGNVFADMGLENAEETLAKAEVASRVCEIITERKLSQAMAARVLGVDQPKVSALMRGRLEGFSSDRLFRFLNALDSDVEIVIKPKSKEAEHGSVHVVVG